MSIESSREREEIQFLCAKVYDVESIERGGSHEAGIVEVENVGQILGRSCNRCRKAFYALSAAVLAVLRPL